MEVLQVKPYKGILVETKGGIYKIELRPAVEARRKGTEYPVVYRLDDGGWKFVSGKLKQQILRTKAVSQALKPTRKRAKKKTS